MSRATPAISLRILGVTPVMIASDCVIALSKSPPNFTTAAVARPSAVVIAAEGPRASSSAFLTEAPIL
jgi:hypothetical protein